MTDGKDNSPLEEKAAKLQSVLLNWVLPVMSVVTLALVWMAVTRGWERGAIVNVVILVCMFFIARSFYHFSKKQFKK